jgi:gliding motility-associated-like protein
VLPVINLGDDGPLCAGSSAVLDAGAGYASYTWSTGSAARSISVSQPGFFRVRVTDANGCGGEDSLTITALIPLPSNFLPADTSFCGYGTLELIPGGAYSRYVWNTGQSTPRISVSRAGTYWLEVTDINNCRGRDSVVVTARDCLTGVWVPNAFTPGGDGVNDFFRPLVSGALQEYRFSVFNRFGEQVFSSADPAQSWDGTYKGKAQSSGVFTWVFRYQLAGQEPKTEKGTVMLIR